MKVLQIGICAGLMCLVGCNDVIDLDPIDNRSVVEPRVRPKAIVGGTLAVTDDGIAIAADPDRNVIHIVDVNTARHLRTIELQPGDSPGRVTPGADGLAHVVLRGYGGFATIDVAAGTVKAVHPVCSEPRGIAYDDAADSVHVACADGSLVELAADTGEERDRVVYEPDLRDVVLHNGERYVTRLRSAELARVGDDPSSRWPDGGGFVPAAPTVAWKTFSHDDGIVMIHELASKQSVPIGHGHGDFAAGDGGDGGGDTPYGGGAGGFGCGPGIATAAVTVFNDEGDAITTPLANAPLAMDAVAGSSWIAFAMPGAKEGESTAGVVRFFDGCTVQTPAGDVGQVTSIARGPGSSIVMFSREPAQIVIQDNAFSSNTKIVDLPGESVYDSGHEIFHRVTDSGLTCATCHPEGGDDGHVWKFETLGKRRTQPLDVGLANTAPFHWNGDMADVDMLMDEVLSHRMGGMRQSPSRTDSFKNWLFAQKRPAVKSAHDTRDAVDRGQTLFLGMNCQSCHNGEALGGGASTIAIRGMDDLQVPSLRRVSLRPPYMHDGRSKTLEDAVIDMIETTTHSDHVSDADVAAMVAYLRTL